MTTLANSHQSREPEFCGPTDNPSLSALEEYCAALDRRCTSRPASRFSIRVQKDEICVGDDNYGLDPKGWSRLASQFHAPSDYWNALDPEFRAQVAQFHFRRHDHLSSNAARNQLDVVAIDGQFRGFQSSHLVRLRLAQGIQGLRRGLGSDEEAFRLHRMEVNDTSVSVELVTPRMNREVRVNDEVQGGISFSHSLTGEHPTTVELFSLRCVCTNGMELRHCIGQTSINRTRRLKRRGESSTIAAIEQIERMTAQRLPHLNRLLDSFKELPDHTISKAPGQSDEATMRHFLMPQLRASRLWSDKMWNDAFRPAWEHADGGQGELTEFAAINTITHVATHRRDLSFRQRRTLARLAGLLTYRREHVCPYCRRAVAGAQS